MRKISLLLMLSLVLTVLGGCGDRQADVENHKNDHKIQILKKPFSTTQVGLIKKVFRFFMLRLKRMSHKNPV